MFKKKGKAAWIFNFYFITNNFNFPLIFLTLLKTLLFKFCHCTVLLDFQLPFGLHGFDLLETLVVDTPGGITFAALRIRFCRKLCVALPHYIINMITIILSILYIDISIIISKYFVYGVTSEYRIALVENYEN